MWKCKNCGGEIIVCVSKALRKNYRVDKNKNEQGDCLKQELGDYVSKTYSCEKCGKWYNAHLSVWEDKLEDIAEWVDD